MSKAFVLMTAMPPTIGHLQLIRFANLIADDGVEVILCTQAHEPFAEERASALRQAVSCQKDTPIHITHLHRTIEQDPSAPGFWQLWHDLMVGFGVTPQDYIVASESYGQKLAEITGAQFFPYDIDRVITPVKATPIRDNPYAHFAEILPEFQRYIQTTVTIFGAESTGKTTLSRALAAQLDGQWLFEYARPYLEHTINEITPRSMRAIWRGQAALQKQVHNLAGKPYIIQDTDLFSTVGYWQFPHWQSEIGTCPSELVREANQLKSDLYIITKSNIPFEKDPLRYGGDVREGSDEYWIGVCEQYNLPYVVLESSNQNARTDEAIQTITACHKKIAELSYDRHGL